MSEADLECRGIAAGGTSSGVLWRIAQTDADDRDALARASGLVSVREGSVSVREGSVSVREGAGDHDAQLEDPQENDGHNQLLSIEECIH
jgi:hypothetical protein